jgi:hypothetical protein
VYIPLALSIAFCGVVWFIRVMSRKPDVKGSDYKLFAIIALWMAWKFEGDYDDSASEFISKLTEEAGFQYKDVKDREFIVLRLLSYRLMAPTSWKLLYLYRDAGMELSEEELEAAYRVMSLALLCDGMVDVPASRLAAAAIFLATKKDSIWVS